MNNIKNNIKIYVATKIDNSRPNSHGDFEVVGLFGNEHDAREAVFADMRAWYDANRNRGIGIDFGDMKSWFTYNMDVGCRWFVRAAEYDRAG